MDDSDYNEKAQQIRRLSALPPDQLIDHLSKTHSGLEDIAPNITPHIHTAAANAIGFLNSKLPRVGNEMPQDTVPPVSIAQQKQWLGLHRVIDDPLSVLEHANNGTLNHSHIEALKAVYPDLHQEMVNKAQEQLGKLNGRHIPYAKRVAIAKLAGAPLDSTMTQANMQAIQMAASPNQGPAAQAGKKASGVELKQINKVNAIYSTPQQDREMKQGK